MINYAALVSALCLQFLVACSAGSLPQGLYEGVKTHNYLQQTPSETLGKPDPPDYAQYQRMRQEQNR